MTARCRPSHRPRATIAPPRILLAIATAIATAAAIHPLIEDVAITFVLLGILFVTAVSLFYPGTPDRRGGVSDKEGGWGGRIRTSE